MLAGIVTNADCYRKGVKPDFVIPGRGWIDFKLHVSYRESFNVAWKPSPLYASLRKYVDHVANNEKKLVIVYGMLSGTMADVQFPIKRGAKVLIEDRSDFASKIILVCAQDVLVKLNNTDNSWIVDSVKRLLKR